MQMIPSTLMVAIGPLSAVAPALEWTAGDAGENLY
jgi:hypothetical protein